MPKLSSKKKPLNRRSLKKRSLKNRSSNKKSLKKINIINKGTMRTFTTIGNKSTETELNWDGNYDGKNAEIHAKLDNNGKVETYDRIFNNNEIGTLLGYSPVKSTLEDRLQKDWTLDTNEKVPIFTNDNKMLFFNDKPMKTRKMTIVI